MPNATDFLGMNDSDLEELKNAAMRASSLASRTRGAGSSARAVRSVPSNSKDVAYVGENAASRYVAPGQDEASDQARDDNSHAPQAAANYLDGIQSDPEYRDLERQHTEALRDMGGTGFAINNWLSHGNTSAAASNRIAEIAMRKREIEKRYLDKAVYDAAQQERFNYAAPVKEWNREKASYENVTYGSRGTRKVMGETTGDVKPMMTSAGEMVYREQKPGGVPMENDYKVGRLKSETEYPTFGYPGSQNTPYEEGPFAGGVASVEPAMKPIGMTPEEQAKVVAEVAKGKASTAEEALRNAQAESARKTGRYIDVAPGHNLVDPDTKSSVYAAPDLESRLLRGSGSGVDRTSPTGSALLGAVRSVYLDLKKTQEANAYLNPGAEVKDPQTLWLEAQEIVKLENGVPQEEAGTDFMNFSKYALGKPKPRNPATMLPNPNAAGGGFGSAPTQNSGSQYSGPRNVWDPATRTFKRQ